MLKAYFDASATQVQAGIYLIGGYVADEANWTVFEGEWQRNLDDWEIADFHLTDCMAGRAVNKRTGQQLGREKGELCARSFGRLIESAGLSSTSSGLAEDDWQALPASGAFRNRYPQPYQFLFHHIVRQLAEWGHRRAPGELIAPVFDIDTGWDKAGPIYDEIKRSPFFENLLPSVTFGSRRIYLPIQAADFLAGEGQRNWFDKEYPVEHIPLPRQNYGIVTPNHNPYDHVLWTTDPLERAAESFDRTGDPFSWFDAPASEQPS